MSKAKRIVEWIFIGLFLVIVVSFLSIQSYRAIVNSEWYVESQTKKGFSKTVEKLNDAYNIDYVKIDYNSIERIVYDIPAELFDDISVKSYERISDVEKMIDIWSQDFVAVFFKDGSYTSFNITDDEEIYWGTDLKVECPSLLFLYNTEIYNYSTENEELLFRRLYVYKDSQNNFKPKFSLFDDGTFEMTFSLESSYLGIGTYTLEDGRLILSTDDGEYVYCFDAVGDTYVFDADASSDMVWFSDVSDGAIFE